MHLSEHCAQYAGMVEYIMSYVSIIFKQSFALLFHSASLSISISILLTIKYRLHLNYISLSTKQGRRRTSGGYPVKIWAE